MVGLETVAPALSCGSQLHDIRACVCYMHSRVHVFNREPLDISLQMVRIRKTLTLFGPVDAHNLTLFDHFVPHDVHRLHICMLM